MRQFFSLLISLFIGALGDVANLSIANNISFAAIGVMGAYYTITLFTGELAQFGIYAYRVERRDEWAYMKLTAALGAAVGLVMTSLSGIIPQAFGISSEQKEMLSSMLMLGLLYLPLSATGEMTVEALRLRGELIGYRRSVIAFFVVSISANLAMFVLIRQVWCVVVAIALGNLAVIVIGFRYQRALPFPRVTRRHISCVFRYGAPLVGERMIQRVGLSVYGIFASYLPPELYAVHSICLQAVYDGDIGDFAYSTALLVVVPDKDKEEGSRERYVSERERMIAYRRKTAWLAVAISFATSYVFAFVSHAEADLGLVMWYTFFYAFSFIIMAYSTPAKDFLVIQKEPVKVMLATFCGVPFFVLLPAIAVFLVAPHDALAALYLFGLTGTAQMGVRAVLYAVFLRKMDRRVGVDKKELREGAREVRI